MLFHDSRMTLMIIWAIHLNGEIIVGLTKNFFHPLSVLADIDVLMIFFRQGIESNLYDFQFRNCDLIKIIWLFLLSYAKCLQEKIVVINACYSFMGHNTTHCTFCGVNIFLLSSFAAGNQFFSCNIIDDKRCLDFTWHYENTELNGVYVESR